MNADQGDVFNEPPARRTPGSEELVYRFRWSVTQIVAIFVGILLTAIGGIALARAGSIGISDPFTPEVIVGTWHRTPFMGALELVLGLTLLAAAAQKESPHSLYKFGGAIGLAFGIVLIAAPAAFDSALGASRDTGWLYSFLGLVFLGLGFGAPIVFERDVVRPIDGGEPSTRADLT
ncbi:MAG: hypothetical protein OEM22_04710 [Acidimicrobiia bacterium]|nr:hypothetical protein [Acidimicrobiia bacterium]MDH3471372.1 hypothetical protein [Acidimicrobiia bacterium]